VLVRGSYSVATDRISETEINIEKHAINTDTVRFLGALPDWIILAQADELSVFVVKGDRQFQVYRLKMPMDLSASARSTATAGLAGKTEQDAAPVLWMQSENSLFTVSLASEGSKGWNERIINLSLDGSPLSLQSPSEAFLNIWVGSGELGESTVSGALFYQGKLYPSEGILNAVGIPSPSATPKATQVPSTEDPFWESKGKSTVQTYCGTGCHTHSFGQDPADREVFKNTKNEILRRTALPQNAQGAMPPYGSKPVPENELSELRAWLNSSN
jgi:hypothetical protein